jgi:hypothetical protein
MLGVMSDDNVSRASSCNTRVSIVCGNTLTYETKGEYIVYNLGGCELSCPEW